MIESETASLLRRFAEDGDEAAFRELVNRHVGLVYAAARRQTFGATHLAEDVTQAVFTLLARQAKSLTTHPTLGGWLFTTTRNCTRDAVRAVARRRQHEQEIAAMHEPKVGFSSGEVNWAALAPEIDEALSRLSARDREGILLRFFENRSYAELGATLGLAENTARMRVERALERLRGELQRRGITSTAALLASALAGQPAVAVPASLSGQIATVALAKALAVGAGGVGLTAVFEFMKATKITLTLGLLAVGAAIYEGNVARVAGRRAEEAERGRMALKTQVKELERKFAAAQSRAQAADDDNARLLAIVGQVQQAATARGQSSDPMGRPTRAEVERRYQHGKDLAQAGNYAAALEEYLWCYNQGMLGGNFVAKRGFDLLPEILKLGEKYPPALTALRQRGEAAAGRMLGDPSDAEAAADFGQIFKGLKDDARLLQMLGTLPPGPARDTLLNYGGCDALVNAHRYVEAVAARPLAQMVSSIEMLAATNIPDSVPGVLEKRKEMRAYIIKDAASNFEVLLGAGAVADAQTLAKKLLAYDDTVATKALLAERAAKAGHPELTVGP